MSDDTRRCIVQGLIDQGVTAFALRPMDGGDEALRQEVVVLSGIEALHALPCCDPPAPPPVKTVVMVVTEDGLRVRSVPSAADKTTIVGQVNAGDKLTVEDDANAWKHIAAGVYAGRYVSGAYLKNL